MNDQDLDSLDKMLAIRRHNLRLLEIRRARYGLTETPIELIVNIDNERREIERLEALIELHHLRELIAIYEKQLRELEKRKACYGMTVPLELMNPLDATKEEVDRLRRRAKRLEKKLANLEQSGP